MKLSGLILAATISTMSVPYSAHAAKLSQSECEAISAYFQSAQSLAKNAREMNQLLLSLKIWVVTNLLSQGKSNEAKGFSDSMEPAMRGYQTSLKKNTAAILEITPVLAECAGTYPDGNILR